MAAPRIELEMSPDSAGNGANNERAAQTKPAPQEDDPLGWFGRWLTVIVFLAMLVGSLLGAFVPGLANGLEKATIEHVSIPIAILIWLMVFPMLLHVDFASLRHVSSNPQALIITTLVNYGVQVRPFQLLSHRLPLSLLAISSPCHVCLQPFLMFGLALLFFRVFYADVISAEDADLYVAGSVILGGAPCTGMWVVFNAFLCPWSALGEVMICIVFVGDCFTQQWSSSGLLWCADTRRTQ
jgi:ACR3 family arsenite efflux pump ArsB